MGTSILCLIICACVLVYSVSVYIYCSVPLYVYCSVPVYIYCSVPLYVYCSVPVYIYCSVPVYLYDTGDNSVNVYSSEKGFKVNNDDMVVTIESRLKLMTQKMSQLVNSWNEQTRGLHLDSDGKLRGLCNCCVAKCKTNLFVFVAQTCDTASLWEMTVLGCCNSVTPELIG